MQRLKARLSKSGNPFGKALFNILAKDQLSEADWEDVEDTLLLADVGAGGERANWWRSCATTPASPASPIRPKCVRR